MTAEHATPERTGEDRATPYLLLDLGAVARRLRQFSAVLPQCDLHYAVKANPHPDVLTTVADGGAGFDVASPWEVHAALQTGIDVGGLMYSNPVKNREDIATAHARGVGVFVVDCACEVAKVAEAAPGAAVLARLATSGAGSDWPLSRKFGADEDDCVDLLVAAAAQGLRAAGVVFHTGSQQRDPNAWTAPTEASARIFTAASRRGLDPWLLDLGGGFPAHLDGRCPPLADYGQAIEIALRTAFGSARPRLAIEPGRGLVADAGVLVARVIGVCRRAGQRWVYLDAGVFTGLIETLDEAIRYPLTTSVDPTAAGEDPELTAAVLAGPTCDSADVLYERTPVLLPRAIAEGDLVRFHAAGAYTTCYSTYFNGFEMLATVIADDGDPSTADRPGVRVISGGG